MMSFGSASGSACGDPLIARMTDLVLFRPRSVGG